MKNIKLITLGLLLLTTLTTQAQIAPINENGLAIGGYDVVAYFSGVATKGLESHSEKYNGNTYLFSSEKNRELFKKSPIQFLPQFDGYCAWGVAEKETKFPINPETFDIIDGKLYLFFNGPFDGDPFNTLIPWNAETTKLMESAHKNWNKVKGQ